ncbi:MAG: GYF domain-containing protein [Muribaculaceae bacterium]|nr:GYF domain-containing protein [Muribaculaceae bacterium]
MYYIIYNGQKFGPMPASELVNYGLNSNSEVWTDGLPAWVKAFEIAELAPYLTSNTPQPPVPGGYQNYNNGGYAPNSNPVNNNGYVPSCNNVSEKKMIFGILAIIFGYLGVQYFYIGKITGGIICILLTCVTCGGWELLTFIQGIVALVMDDKEFDRKFLKSNSSMPLF